MNAARPLEVLAATRTFGATRAVTSVDLDLGPGEILALVGPSGCGKSTLLRLVAGLLHLDEGEIRVGGRVVDDGSRALAPERRSVGMVFQDHALFPHMTIARNVAFGLRRRSDASATVDRLLDMVGLADLAARYPHELSGGERQRASLARAMAPGPQLLLLDEPFAALDPNLRAEVRGQVVGLLRETATPALFVSHDQAEALAVGDRVAVMRAGRIEQIGSGPDLYDTPTNRFVAGFVGDASFLPVTGAGEGRVTELGPIDGPGVRTTEGAVAVIRPVDVSLVEAVRGEDGTGVVVGATYTGPEWTYDVRLPSGLVIRSEQPRSRVFGVGSSVRVGLRPGHAVAVVDR